MPPHLTFSERRRRLHEYRGFALALVAVRGLLLTIFIAFVGSGRFFIE